MTGGTWLIDREMYDLRLFPAVSNGAQSVEEELRIADLAHVTTSVLEIADVEHLTLLSPRNEVGGASADRCE